MKNKILITTLTAAMLFTSAASAQVTTTWTGATNQTFGNAGNWDEGLPAVGDTATWDGLQAGNININVAANYLAALQLHFTADQSGNVNFLNTGAEPTSGGVLRIDQTTSALKVDSGAGQVQFGTLTGTSNQLWLLMGRTGGQDFTFTNNSTNPVIFGTNTKFYGAGGTSGALHTIFFEGSGDFDIRGGIDSNEGAPIAVRNQGTGTIDLSGDNSFGGNVWTSGGGIIRLTGTNTLPSANSIEARHGTIEFNSTENLGGAQFLRLGTQSNTGTLRHEGGATVLSSDNEDGLMAIGSGAGSATGVIDASGTGTLTFSDDNFNRSVGSTDGTDTLRLTGNASGQIDGVIRNNSANNVALEVTGTATWTLGGENIYSGNTTVDGGTLVIANGGSIGTAVAVNDGGTLIVNGIINDASAGSGVDITAGGTVGGDGAIIGGRNLLLREGSQFQFDPIATLSLDTGGTVFFYSDWGMANILGLDGSTDLGTYTILEGIIDDTTVPEANLLNVGEGAAVNIGGDRYAFFEDDYGDSDTLRITVIPEPATVGLVFGLVLMAFVGFRRFRK